MSEGLANIKLPPKTEVFWDEDLKRPYCYRNHAQKGGRFKKYLYVSHCVVCKIDFVTWTRGNRFCSKQCKQAAKTGKPYYITSLGYWARDTSRNGKRRSIYEHQDIGEQVLGRKLKKNELVHHINLDKLDNRHSNLLICNKQYHMWLHQEYARQFVALAFTDRLTHVKLFCEQCGNLVAYQAFKLEGKEAFISMSVYPCEHCIQDLMRAVA